MEISTKLFFSDFIKQILCEKINSYLFTAANQSKFNFLFFPILPNVSVSVLTTFEVFSFYIISNQNIYLFLINTSLNLKTNSLFFLFLNTKREIHHFNMEYLCWLYVNRQIYGQ